MSNKITGDITNFTAVEKKGVTLHNMPNVPIADLKKKADIVNDKSQSGKRLGAMLVGVDLTATTGYVALFTAAGSKPEDKWIMVKKISGDATGGDITPA